VLAAFATAALAAAPGPAELSYDLRIDLPVTAALGSGWLLSEYAFKAQLAPATCRWCARNAFDDAGRALRAAPSQVRGARVASDVIGIALVPAAVLGADALLTWAGGGTWREGLVDALLVIEAMVAAQSLNQLVKFAAGRERPFVADLVGIEKSFTDEPEDNNLSFFSGHSSYAFSLVAAAATIARARGYRYWWAVLAVGLPLAATTATLRIVGGKHYLSDVLTGSLLGALIGWGVPALFHRPVQAGPVTAQLTVGASGLALSGRW